MNKIYYILFGIICTLGFASCSESGEDSNEYENWETRNDEYFQEKYKLAQSYIAAGRKDWKIIKCVYLNDSVSTNIFDYIVVEVLDSAKDATKIAYGSPLQTDSVRVFYEGRLIPSASYPQGKVFDCSWTGDYNPKTMVPTSFNVNGFDVDGFATAVQYMHIGDRWRVYIPCDLAYGDESSSTIPAYSNLIFDITLHSFVRKGTAFPTFR